MKYQYKGPNLSKPPLEITDDIQLWLMRMIVGEGGANASDDKIAALLLAIANRWFLWPGARHYSTFVGMMRAFSQPINPRWLRGGSLAKKYAGKPAASNGRLNRRSRICSLGKSSIPRRIRFAVEMFAIGELGLPDIVTKERFSRLSNWASLPSTPRKFPWGVDVDGDWFFEDRNLRPGVVEFVRLPATLVEFVRLPATLAQLEQRVDALERCVGGIRA